MALVYAVVGDIGSAREMVAGMKKLTSPGIEVKWFVDPMPAAKAGDVLKKEGIEYYTRSPVEEDMPDIIVVGTSVTATEAQLQWNQYGKIEVKKPVIWLEDLWGTGERKKVRGVSPDSMFVIDEAAEEIAKRVRPDIEIRIVGKPTFGNTPVDRVDEIRLSTRTSLGIHETDFLITVAFCGDPVERAVEQIKKMIGENSFHYTGREVVAWRFHPKHPDREKLWKIVTDAGIPWRDARHFNLDELEVASDLVVADWRVTDAYKAVLCGIPTLTMLFPEEDLEDIAGYPDGIPPIVKTDLGWGLKKAGEIKGFIGMVIESRESIVRHTKEVRAKPFLPLLKIGADERIAKAVMERL